MHHHHHHHLHRIHHLHQQHSIHHSINPCSDYTCSLTVHHMHRPTKTNPSKHPSTPATNSTLHHCVHTTHPPPCIASCRAPLSSCLPTSSFSSICTFRSLFPPSSTRPCARSHLPTHSSCPAAVSCSRGSLHPRFLKELSLLQFPFLFPSFAHRNKTHPRSPVHCSEVLPSCVDCNLAPSFLQ